MEFLHPLLNMHQMQNFHYHEKLIEYQNIVAIFLAVDDDDGDVTNAFKRHRKFCNGIPKTTHNVIDR